MKKYFIILLIFIVFSNADNASKNEQAGGIIYGKDHAFIIQAPKGWILDIESGVSQGIAAVFYPKGSSWQKSTVIMYINTASKASEENETIEKLIEYDISEFKKHSSSLKIKTAPKIITGDKKKAIVKYFSGDQYGNYEAIAYIDERNIVVMIVLSSRSEKIFKAALPAFKKLVGSYNFLTEKIEIKK